MDHSRDIESDAYAEEHAPPSYYGGDGHPQTMNMKPQMGAPLLHDNQGGHPQYQMQPVSAMPRPGDQVTVVAMAPKNGEEVIYGQEAYGSCHLVCSFISVFFCSLCGLIALVCAMLGYTDFRTGNMKLYKKKRKCAIGWMIIAMLTGCALFALITYARSKLMAQLRQQEDDYYRG